MIKEKKTVQIDKIIAIPSRQFVPYTIPTLINKFNFFNELKNLQPCSLETISKHFRFDERVLEAVLSYLLKEGFIQNIDNKFTLSRLSSEFLVKGAKYDLSPFALLLQDNVPMKNEEAISYSLTTGKPAIWNSGSGAWKDGMRSGSLSKTFSDAMMSRGEYLKDALSIYLQNTMKGHNKLLDIGGSLGDYCGMFTEKFRNLTSDVYELPKVAENARENIKIKKYRGVNVVEGDMFRDDFPKGYDVHFYSNVMHDWTAAQIGYLLKKSFDSLDKGGIVIIHDMHLNDDKKSPDFVVDHSLYLSVFTEGKCYSYEEMKSFLVRVGFSKIKIIKTVVGYSAIIGAK